MSESRVRRSQFFSATQILVIGFLTVIFIGSLLLKLPIASASGESAPFLTCLFTSVSAVCVTGLVVVDTATFWSAFGQCVILLMIQIGGLGFMSMAVLLSMMIRRRISPREKIVLANSYNLSTFDGVIPLIRRIVLGTLIIESLGTLLLCVRFIPLFGLGEGVWKSVFHAVSAFCNAGFDLMGSFSGPFSSLSAFRGDYLVCLTVSALIAVGGIGFVVWDDVRYFFRKKRPLSAYTKLVLCVSAVLWGLGMIGILISEWSNPATLGTLPVSEKFLAALFQSVTMRTAGFNTVDLASCGDAVKLMFLFLMFAGGASGSTAGGVKVSTIGVFCLSLSRFAVAKRHVVAFKRTVSEADITRTFTLIGVQFCITMAAASILSACGVDLMKALFETFSASGTVGLSLNLTSTLSGFPLLIVMILMFFGRVGILTVAAALYGRQSHNDEQMHYADMQLMIG